MYSACAANVVDTKGKLFNNNCCYYLHLGYCLQSQQLHRTSTAAKTVKESNSVIGALSLQVFL